LTGTEFRIKLFSSVTRIRGIAESTFYLMTITFILIIKWLLRKSSDSEKVLIIERILRIGDTITAMSSIKEIENKYGGSNVHRLISDKMKPLVNLFEDEARKIFWKESSIISFLKQTINIRKMVFSRAYILVTDRMSAIFVMLSGIPHTIGYNYNRRGVFLTEPRKPPGFINRPAFAYINDEEVFNIKNVWLNLIEKNTNLKTQELQKGFELNKNDILWAEKRIGHLKRPIVIFHPSSNSTSKLWYKERWIELGDTLISNGWSIIITAGTGEAGNASEISQSLKATCTMGETDIPKLVSLINMVDSVITVDTAIGHISALLDKPTIVLFGSSDERIWRPDGRSVSVVIGNSICIRCKKSKCFQKDRYCMKSITVDMVKKAFFSIP
jgi:ADP-heptose:LPS heptosyltransferase